MKKSTIIVLLVFLALVVVVITFSNRTKDTGITRLTFTTVDPAAVDRIVITGKNPIEMKREKDRWILGDSRRADQDAVKRLLEAVPKIDSTDLVTRDAKRFAELEVDSEKGTMVALYKGGKPEPVAELTIGKTAPGGSGGAYVRAADTVYLARQASPYLFSKAASAWHNLKAFDQKPEEVTRVEVAPGDSAPYALVKREDKWQVEDPTALPAGFRFDAAAASSLVNALLNTRAQEIALDNPPDEKTGLAKPKDTLAFTDKAGQRSVLQLGGKTEKEDRYARVEGSPDVLILNRYHAATLTKSLLDLRDLKLIDLDPEKVTALAIRDGKGSISFEKQGAEWKIGKSSEKIPADFELDPSLVSGRLRALANARAMKIALGTPPAKAGLAKPAATLVATREDGSRVTLTFGKEIKDDKTEQVYATGNIDKDVYLLAKGARTNLTGLLMSFKKRPAPPQGGGMPNLDPQTLSKLPPEVRENLMKQMQEKQQQQQMMQQIQAQIKAKEAAAGKK